MLRFYPMTENKKSTACFSHERRQTGYANQLTYIEALKSFSLQYSLLQNRFIYFEKIVQIKDVA